jgi:hypothetical protein
MDGCALLCRKRGLLYVGHPVIIFSIQQERVVRAVVPTLRIKPQAAEQFAVVSSQGREEKINERCRRARKKDCRRAFGRGG